MIEPFASIYAAMARQVIELRETLDRMLGRPVVESQEIHYVEGFLFPVIPALNYAELGHGVQWKQLDRRYWATTRAGMEHIIGHEWAHDQEYIVDRFDCEDFALQFKARCALVGVNAVALVVDDSTAHAYCLVFMLDQEPQVYDPQQRTWGRIGDRLYRLEAGVVLL